MSALDVLLGGTRVGLLERVDEWQYRFSFDASWLADPAHPVLGQIFEDRLPRDMESTGTLPTWFDHLLPPQGGPLRRAVSRQSGIEGDDDFALLELLGGDLPGAVTLVPGRPSLARPQPSRSSKPRHEGSLRFSLAGMQWKLSVREQDRKLTLPLRGETGGWIAKFPSPTYKDLPRVELATMTWVYPDGRRPRLAPAYDLVASTLYEPIATSSLALTLASSRRFEDASLASFKPFATVTRRSFDEVSGWVRHMVERVLTVWQDNAPDLAYLPDERTRLDAHLERVPLARGV